jgi:predicted nucleic acid-binding protein
MACLIDTDVMIDVSRGNPNAASYLDSLSDPAISIVTAQELIVGARNKRDVAGIDSLISTYPVMHIDADISRLAYDLLKRYARSDGLRTFDSLIAATAIERDFALVTRNRKHFAMIDGLRLEAPRYASP